MSPTLQELVVQWFVSSRDNASMYPITDPYSSMMTSTDDEIEAHLVYSATLVRYIFTLLPPYPRL